MREADPDGGKRRGPGAEPRLREDRGIEPSASPHAFRWRFQLAASNRRDDLVWLREAVFTMAVGSPGRTEAGDLATWYAQEVLARRGLECPEAEAFMRRLVGEVVAPRLAMPVPPGEDRTSLAHRILRCELELARTCRRTILDLAPASWLPVFEAQAGAPSGGPSARIANHFLGEIMERAATDPDAVPRELAVRLEAVRSAGAGGRPAPPD